MEEYIVTDGMNQFVEYYNATNHVMAFTNDREKCWRTCCSQNAFNVARIARELYGKKCMKMQMAWN